MSDPQSRVPNVPPGLLGRYDKPGPRYTSYPTAPSWNDEYGPADHADRIRSCGSSERAGEPLSMYVHLPYCESMCWFCGCNVVITQDRGKGANYVDEVLREAELARSFLGDDADRPVHQHHWGGGTPTFLPPEHLVRLFEGLTELFPLHDEAEVSIEVDPRVTSREQLEALREAGFNRVSMGVQDFNEKVQKAIHRIQPYEMTRKLVDDARSLGFESVNIDLIYGLPYQDEPSFAHTLERALSLKPDRVACYSYAHVPWLKKHQSVIPEDALPTGEAKLNLYLQALGAFGAEGYVPIGMDHFASGGDSLAEAAERGILHRNFMGYTTSPAEDMLSFGMTAISEVDGAFAQNRKTLKEWLEGLDAGELPVERGLRRDEDDAARRRIILDMMCHFRVEFADHGGVQAFRTTYADELEALRPMADDGLVELHDDHLSVTRLGRLFVRNLCMPFDAWLHKKKGGEKAGSGRFSRTV
jgi:oxygen-independent coproporphyrinogen-3 oxidase